MREEPSLLGRNPLKKRGLVFSNSSRRKERRKEGWGGVEKTLVSKATGHNLGDELL